MENTGTKTIYFLTGTSGVGKTTLVEGLRKKYGKKPWSFLHFDAIGVPSLAEMQREYGSPMAWQKAKTFEWIDRLVLEYKAEKIFFEGQSHPLFILEGFARHYIKNYRVVLVDCSEEDMAYRLAVCRAQPELVTKEMNNWLRHLREQAKALHIPVVVSSHHSPEELVSEFEKKVGLWDA